MGAMNVVNKFFNYFARIVLLACALISLIALLWSAGNLTCNSIEISGLMLSSLLVGVLPISPVYKSRNEKCLYLAICFLGTLTTFLVYKEYIFSPHVRTSIKFLVFLIFCSFVVMAIKKYKITKT
jgi:hypothetical protein